MFAYVKIGSVEYVLSVLNSFHKNIKFTYEEERNNILPFLDVLFIRDGEKLSLTAYRKDTHNDLYLHWKRGMLKSLISRVYKVCSNETPLSQYILSWKHQHEYNLWILPWYFTITRWKNVLSDLAICWTLVQSSRLKIKQKINQGGHSIFSKNSRTIQEHFKNILLLFKNTIKRPEK